MDLRKRITLKEWEETCDSLQGEKKIIEPKDSIVESVREDLDNRSKVGIKKYGVTLDRTDLSLSDWLQHAYEETLDNALYLKRAMKDLKK